MYDRHNILLIVFCFCSIRELFAESYFINTTYYRRARVIVVTRYFALFMPVVML